MRGGGCRAGGAWLSPQLSLEIQINLQQSNCYRNAWRHCRNAIPQSHSLRIKQAALPLLLPTHRCLLQCAQAVDGDGGHLGSDVHKLVLACAEREGAIQW